MPHVHARDLKQDILFRASESLVGASGWEAKTIDYLNRAYRSLANGASEFLPDYVDDWWWMRAKDTLILQPLFIGGSISLTQGASLATLSNPPAFSLEGYRIRMTGQPDVFTVESHAPSATDIILDDTYTGTTALTAVFDAMKVEYTLNAAVTSMLSPMSSYRGPRIAGTSPERMDELYPISRLRPGIPTMFCLEDERTVRFNAGGLEDGKTMRLEYYYRPSVVDLTDSVDSIPLVPLQYRHLLSDMALAFLLTDKADDRAAVHASSAKAGITAMYKENRRRRVKMDYEVGTIRPRGMTQHRRHLEVGYASNA